MSQKHVVVVQMAEILPPGDAAHGDGKPMQAVRTTPHID
jgi:hypothetical protein